MKKTLLTGFTLPVILALLLMPGCPVPPDENDSPDRPQWSTSADFKPENNWPRPMLWSGYENLRLQDDRDGGGDFSNWMRETDFRLNIDWVEKELLPHGYNYVTVDGWGDGVYNKYGYRIKHDGNWNYTYKDWSQMLRKRGMKLAMYDNPLWLNGADPGAKIQGTEYYIGDIAERDWAKNLQWVDVTRPGAEEFVKGNIRHWSEMGVDYLKIDFMAWYESGHGNEREGDYENVGRTDRPREHYETALRWIREEADKRGVFISLARANLMKYAELEAKYCHMIRIGGDIWDGNAVKNFTNKRGVQNLDPVGNPLFPFYGNQYDGFLYFSGLSGPGKVMLDGDYMWFSNKWWNTAISDNPKRAIVTMHVMAGGIVSLTEQYNTYLVNNTTDSVLPFYQKEELLKLVKEGFVAKPLSTIKFPKIDPVNRMRYGTSTVADIDTGEVNGGNPVLISETEMENYSHVWWGECKNGDYVVAFFNRESAGRDRTINFLEDVGITVDSTHPIVATELWGQGTVTQTLTGNQFQIPSGTLTGASGNNAGNVMVYRLSRP